MIIDYPGQELIWNLTATHPYKQNRGNYKIYIRCKEISQNHEYKWFFMRHLGEKITIKNAEYFDASTNIQFRTVKRIIVPDALGGFGEVEFLNEFAKEVI